MITGRGPTVLVLLYKVQQFRCYRGRGLINRRLLVPRKNTLLSRRDCIYTETLQHIPNPYHPYTDLENIRKDKQGKFALIFKDVHRFGNAEIDGSVLLNGKTLTQGHVVIWSPQNSYLGGFFLGDDVVSVV
eukprot:COSAG01_NODE_4898_length_4644_cov_14.434763_2_plen_131_part_00